MHLSVETGISFRPEARKSECAPAAQGDNRESPVADGPTSSAHQFQFRCMLNVRRRPVFLRNIALSVLLTWSAPGQGSAPPAGPDKDRAARILNDALADKNPETRKSAVESLGLTKPY